MLRGLAANSGLDIQVLEPLLGLSDQSVLVALAERADLTGVAATALTRQPNPVVGRAGPRPGRRCRGVVVVG